MSTNKKIDETENYVELGLFFLQSNQIQKALDNFQKAIKLDQHNFKAWNNLGVSMQIGGYTSSELIPVFARAVHLNESYFDARFNLAMMLKDIRNWEKAAEQFYKAIEIDDKMVRAYNELSLCLRELGRNNEAKKVLRKALTLEQNIPQLYNNLGNVLGDLGEFKSEKKAYLKALKIDPNYAIAWANLGTTYNMLGDNNMAILSYEKAIKLAPTTSDFYLVKATVLQEENRLVEARDYYKKAIDLDPKSSKALNSYFLVKRQLCDWQGLEDLEAKMDEVEDEDPFTSIVRCEDPQKNLEVAKKWSAKLYIKENIENDKFDSVGNDYNNKKIHIGYVSNDLRDHPIGQMVAQLFGLHNRKEFEIYVYSSGRNDGSTFHKEAVTGSDYWRDIRNQTNEKVAEIIKGDKIDILVDLTGYTLGNRLGIFARRPSKIQITWLGFPGTSGASFFDYLISDKTVVPKAHRVYYSEKVLYMPDCYQINNNTIKISEDKMTRDSLGIPQNAFVFASFNQSHKIDPAVFAMWMEILRKVPNSILWLWEQDREASVNLANEAEKLGVSSARIIFSGRESKERHLKRLSFADLGLDTLVYGGHTTTSDMLYAGTPVVTILGGHFASRVSASILRTVGLDKLIAVNKKDYVKKAVYFANNNSALLKFRKKIGKEKLKKNLFDTKKFVKSLEDLYHFVLN